MSRGARLKGEEAGENVERVDLNLVPEEKRAAH